MRHLFGWVLVVEREGLHLVVLLVEPEGMYLTLFLGFYVNDYLEAFLQCQYKMSLIIYD